MKVFIAALIFLNGSVMAQDSLTLTVVYDNNLHTPGLTAEWGFACLITGFEKTILFDTGGDGKVLLDNMEHLNVNPMDIDIVFISHDHWDHTGGLKALLQENRTVEVQIPSSFSDEVKEAVRVHGAELVENDSLKMLFPRVYTTGSLGTTIQEQSLVLEAEDGLIVITGCAHPGVVDILRYVKENFDQDIQMVFGGFHLGGVDDQMLDSIISQFRRTGVKKTGPCHCSGDRCRELFEKEYGGDFLKLGVGACIRVE
jgi:7,8-dihydropterin-6-yl-methyl-4-(beta-D-ribofuranosyl)aminobenzene 5'-phosphate synthase